MPTLPLTMDRGRSYHPPCTHQQPGNSLYRTPTTLETQLGLPTAEDSASGCWSSSLFAPSPYAAPFFLNENQQYFNNPSNFYANSTNGQLFPDSNFTPQSLADFIPRNGDFPRDSAYLNELSNNSLFSSPADSLSDIADIQEFIPADSLNPVPTLWDVNVNVPQQNPMEVLPPDLEGLEGLQGIDNHITATQDISRLSGIQSQTQVEEEEEGDDDETEELGHTETYADYIPSKSKIGKHHPDRVVETSTLSSIPPPDITYVLSLPESIAENGFLSALQLEAIIYACQEHENLLPNGQRAGFLIGDGAGVGKGRTIAGIIYENYLKGRKKALWFSVSNDLKYDAERDLKDINAPNLPVHALNKIKYGDTATSEGILFATYSALIGESQAGGQHRTRLKQILDWCKDDFDGVIVFDECHKAKNASSTKMGKAVLDLQKNLPQARVVYASATGASEPKNMIYMSRLGIWGDGTPFPSFDDFLHAIEKRGVGAMEIVAMDMKVNGMYIARQLSFSGVTFRIEEIPLEAAYKDVYNKAAKLWAEALVVFQKAADLIGLESRKSLWGQFWGAHQRFFKYLCIAAKVRRLVELVKEELIKGKCVVIGLQSTGEARTREVLDENEGHLDCFVSAAEGVFLSLIRKHFPSTKRKRERGSTNKRKLKQRDRGLKKVMRTTHDHYSSSNDIIKISSESSTESEPGLESDFNSSPESLVEMEDVASRFKPLNGAMCNEPIGLYWLNPQKEMNPHREMNGSGTPECVENMKQELLSQVKELGKELPLNTLDQLIDDFGGPENVAEMTGRKGRVVRRPGGSVVYESRAEQGLSIDHVNLKEKERFMNGDKLVAIISEASSSGISLQADRRVKNQKRRVHMTLELPWSADRAIQQFGRTHRSNQVSAPEYIFLISELAGERRFASIVAKRLESLGALTHGDRRATESRDLSKYNFENKYGIRALDKVLRTIFQQTESKVPVPKIYQEGDAAFFSEMKQSLLSVGISCKEMRYGFMTMEKDCSITKFLNRILGLEVDRQNLLFQYFNDTFDYLIERDKKDGKYDMGILDLAPGIDEIYEESKEVFLTPGHPQDGQVVFYKISVDRGLKWEEVCEKSLHLTGPNDGFYLSHKVRGNKYICLLAEQTRGKYFTLYKPNIGKQSQLETMDSLLKKYRSVSPADAQPHWESSYDFSLKHCNHAVWNRNCKVVQEGKECFQGTRLRHYYMLCGALLRVWTKIAGIMANITNTSYLQIVRLKTKEKKKQVGIKIPENCVHQVLKELKQMDENIKQKQIQAMVAPMRPSQPHPPLVPLLDLSRPAGFLSAQQDEVWDLTNSPPGDCLPDFWTHSSSPSPPLLLSLPPTPSPFNFHAPYDSTTMVGGGLALSGSPAQHEPLAPAPALSLPPVDSFSPASLNFRELLEEMMLNPHGLGAENSEQERQSVIQFSGPLTNLFDAS
ncbi:protein strawberry notch homolog 2 isoform X1 [Erythrolamprus reginae]|uniref:protein strawberry notch homolog 2 isoform X1 n=1 Tax=Erythrolamprus reginae TaxID=121349 RepID=UPI00396C5E83